MITYESPPGYVCKATLEAWGWTHEEIKSLGEPDQYDRNPYGGSPVCLYSRKRVRDITRRRQYEETQPFMNILNGSMLIAEERTGQVKTLIDANLEFVTEEEEDNAQFLRIPKENLENHELNKLQRSPSKVKYYRDNWDNGQAAVLFASYQQGRVLVLDGGTRLEAAPRGNIFRVLVFFDLTKEREAELWHGWNVMRTNKNPVARFRNDLIRGEADAIAIDAMLRRNNRAVGDCSSARTLKAIKAVRDVYKRHPVVLDTMFDLICEFCEREVVTEPIIKGTVFVQRQLQAMPHPVSLNEPHWRKRYLNMSYKELKDELKPLKNNAAELLYAQKILNALNKGLRNKLMVKGLNDIF